jgi:hypothetical protein
MLTSGSERDAHGTGRKLRTEALALVLVLGACGRATAGECGHPDAGRPHVFQRVHPAGGWHPDSGGLFHWWNPHCFPRCGGPDDYCRKPPPNVCWPPYPPFYTWGPPQLRSPHPAGGLIP